MILKEKDSNQLLLIVSRDWISLFKERNLTKPKVGLEGEVRTCGQSRFETILLKNTRWCCVELFQRFEVCISLRVSGGLTAFKVAEHSFSARSC